MRVVAVALMKPVLVELAELGVVALVVFLDRRTA